MNKTVIKKITLFLLIFFFLFLLADFSLAKKCATDAECGNPAVVRCINGECVRALEITYPKIAGEELTEQRIVKEGLPGYVKYIFTIAVGIIGFIIFGVLIHSGILYLTSAGNPSQMSDARDRMLKAFLGGILLLASVLIFNTINPQLAIMELPKVEPLEQVIVPGIYICNYPVNKSDLEKNLNDYISEKGEKQIEAAKKLRDIVWKPNTKQGCPRVNFSGNFQNFKVTETGNTIFAVPSISINPETGKRTIKYEYGIVLHERDNFGGRCKVYPEKDGKIYGEDDKDVPGQIEGYSAKGLGFTAYSVTLFQKPSAEPVGDGVTIYKGFQYNELDPKASTSTDQKSFKPEGNNDIRRVGSGELGGLKNNTRSISFSPPGSYLALLFEKDNFDGMCKVLDKNYPNLLDVLKTAGECKTGFWAVVDIFHLGPCIPLLNSMIVIKGNRL